MLAVFAGAFAIAVMLPTLAAAEGMNSGADLVRLCATQDPSDPGFGHLVCVSYLRGVYEGAGGGYVMGSSTELFCPPHPMTDFSDLRTVFLDYARRHSEVLNQAPDVVAVGAFLDAFPCPSPSPQKPLR